MKQVNDERVMLIARCWRRQTNHPTKTSTFKMVI